MKLHSKLIVSAAALAAGCVLLAGCGASSSSSTASSAAPSSSTVASVPSSIVSSETNGETVADDAIADAVDTFLAVNPISNQFELTAMNIEYDFGLAADDVVSYKGVKSNDNGDAGLVLVIRPAEGKAEELANKLETYKEDQVAFYGNYAEFAQAQSNVENAVIGYTENGSNSVVFLVIASNEYTGSNMDAISQAAENVIDTIAG